MFYSMRKDRSVWPSLLSTFLLYGSAECWGLVKCCQSLISSLWQQSDGCRDWRSRGFVFLSITARIQVRNPHTFQANPSLSSSSFPYTFPLPLFLSLTLSLLTNGINRPWNNQCWWSILEPVDMLMSTPHRYCCRVINHCLLPECTAAGAANPRPGIKHCLLTINVQTFCCPVPWLFSDAKKVGRIVNQ